jgi:hypothetical protein
LTYCVKRQFLSDRYEKTAPEDAVSRLLLLGINY